jgi:hypothetical protein
MTMRQEIEIGPPGIEIDEEMINEDEMMNKETPKSCSDDFGSRLPSIKTEKQISHLDNLLKN